VDERPLRKARAERPHRTLGLAVAQRGGRMLLVRRVPRGLLGGLWELPGCEAPSVEALPAALERDLAAHLGLTLLAAVHHGAVEHGYSHFSLTAHLYVCQIEGDPTPGGPWDQAAWLAPEELADYGLTGLTTKALASLQAQPSLWEWAADGR
jgi:A/G-specific adenine glycosylase